ncbi:hypothetical protein AIOL_001826 [Candidatus Rhodobacter oscarellae]|uniref:DUF1330 domain-containing protein n=1 Tax=Candidatus Rhodobacter oscarellae TaxID=1675527 RepID=A0A0J9E4Y4_9RHOB|nr:DUF1330 domain-containing protein [Candidatus Rhodobacter lobularis]KMW56869.1 hypothetical protein AIOL_001826 [Candidatus Rhodobacter lobularis]
MSALWIATVKVTDDEAYAKYAALATEAIKAGGGEILARGGRYVQLEGPDRPRNVVVRYPSLEAAEAVYNSETYQKALTFAVGASEREVVVVEEV